MIEKGTYYIDLDFKDVVQVIDITKVTDNGYTETVLKCKIIHDPSNSWAKISDQGSGRIVKMHYIYFIQNYEPYKIAETPLWQVLNTNNLKE